MSKQSWFNALCYEIGLWAAIKRPSLALQPWFKMFMAHCHPDWTEWKTKIVMEKIDEQASALVKQWDQDERESKANALAWEAHKLFPDATITPLPNAIVPSVLIEEAPSADASEAVKALGGGLRITYQLNQTGQPPSV